MDLREYLFRKKMSVAQFGRNINYAPGYISRIIHNKKKPGKKLAKIIEKATDGEVKADELIRKYEQENNPEQQIIKDL